MNRVFQNPRAAWQSWQLGMGVLMVMATYSWGGERGEAERDHCMDQSE